MRIVYLNFEPVLKMPDYQIYVVWGCSALKGMSFLCLAGDFLDWQWWRCVKWLVMEMRSRTCNITISPVCGLLLI